MTDLLQVEGLCVRYSIMGRLRAVLSRTPASGVAAVADVSFRIRAGTTFGLVGESGSGKTTIGRAIVGLIPPESGRISLMGREIGHSDAELKPWRRDVAMVFQDPIASLSPRLTVRSLIVEPHRIHSASAVDPDSEASRLLDMVGLPKALANRYPHELSGGQARRVGIARALALSPKLLIADEPTAGLDVSVQGEILNLFAELQQQHGLAYLLITHNLSAVRHVCDQVAVMYLGRIVEKGPSQVVFRAPAHPYTHALLASQPDLNPDKRRNDLELTGEIPSLLNRPDGCEFHTRCDHGSDICRSDAPPIRAVGGCSVACHFPLR